MNVLGKYRRGYISGTVKQSTVAGILFALSLVVLILSVVWDADIITYAALAVMLCSFVVLCRNNWRVYQRLREKSYVDSVTGGDTFVAFQAKYQIAVKKNQNSSAAIVMLNVRNFRLVNERYGFKEGDALLRTIYRCIEQELCADRYEFLCRGETDHFFICLNENSPEIIQGRLENMLNRIEERDSEGRGLSMVIVKTGCCISGNPSDDLQILIEKARIAEKYNKPEYQLCLFYDGKIVERRERENNVLMSFEDALANKEFEVYLQPKVSFKEENIVGAEALVRWNRPGTGIVPPAEFIPLLEKSGQICALDLFVFTEVCKLYQKREREGEKWYPVSVNLSRRHFNDKNFIYQFIDIAKAHNLKAGSVEFELTETMFFEQQSRNIENVIHVIHENGYLCSIDDFGVGYSSLGMLRDYHLDTVKLDRSFFTNIETQRSRDVIQGVVALITRLHMQVVAEGIETIDQIEYLKSIGCDTVQGYYFSKPLPVSEFEAWAKARSEPA